MPRDPLAVLARLRRIETDRARRLVAERLARESGAEAGHAAACTALVTEREAAAAHPAAHAAWLPRALAARDRTALARDLAVRDTAAARDALAEARAAERALEMLAEARAAEARRAALRAEQARLDAFAARRR